MTNTMSAQHALRSVQLVRLARIARSTARMRARWRSRWYVARPWMYAAALLAGGVSVARSAAPVKSALHAPLRLAPVVVKAPSAGEMRLVFRSDTVARMLRRHHVDSLNASQWARAFVAYGDELHVNPKLLVAIAYAESEFNPSAHSPAGAIGLMQVVPSRRSWGEYEHRCGRMTARNLREPHVNICFGAHIFKEFLTVHHGDTDHALAAYNNGSGELNGYPDRVYSSLAVLRH
jgi:soluble lytic murein transglycosylase-like protein